MAGLLDNDDLDEIHDAIREVTDTFLKLPVTYHKRGTKVGVFMEDVQGTNNDYNIECLQVFNASNEDATATITRQGKVDFSEGYLLFNCDYLIEQGLASPEGIPVFEAEVDYFTIAGEEFEVIGVPPLGQLDTQFMVAKVLFKRKQKKE